MIRDWLIHFLSGPKPTVPLISRLERVWAGYTKAVESAALEKKKAQ
jgi:hypothetical protein